MRDTSKPIENEGEKPKTQINSIDNEVKRNYDLGSKSYAPLECGRYACSRFAPIPCRLPPAHSP